MTTTWAPPRSSRTVAVCWRTLRRAVTGRCPSAGTGSRSARDAGPFPFLEAGVVREIERAVSAHLGRRPGGRCVHRRERPCIITPVEYSTGERSAEHVADTHNR